MDKDKIKTLYERAEYLITSNPDLFTDAGSWFDDYTTLETWKKQTQSRIESLKKEDAESPECVSIKKKIEDVTRRLKSGNPASFFMMAPDAWEEAVSGSYEPDKVAFIFWLLHRRYFLPATQISKFVNYPFPEFTGKKESPEYHDEIARSIIFDTDPKSYKIAERSVTTFSLTEGHPIYWNDPAFIPNTEALKLADGRMSLSQLTKILNSSGNTIRFVRQGQRCKVHVQDFMMYVKNIGSDITDEVIAEYLADVEKVKEQLKRSKK